MISTPLISILLSTYNGENYLSEQLDSIINQTNSNWRLLVRDDGSTDTTVKILRMYQKRFPQKIFVLEFSAQNIGVNDSFGQLLSHANTDYIMFCDQDDIWSADKVERTYQRMKDLELKFSSDKPLLVHSDMRVVDRSLTTISNSFWRYQKLNPERDGSLEKLIVQNVVTGCTMMINRQLAKMSLPISPDALTYDWWIALVAVSFGKISHISEPLVNYRQHAKNIIGAKHWGMKYFISEVRKVNENRQRLWATQRQTAAFINRFNGEFDQSLYKILWKYANIKDMGFFTKRIFLLKNGFLKTGFIRNIGMLLWI